MTIFIKSGFRVRFHFGLFLIDSYMKITSNGVSWYAKKTLHLIFFNLDGIHMITNPIHDHGSQLWRVGPQPHCVCLTVSLNAFDSYSCFAYGLFLLSAFYRK